MKAKKAFGCKTKKERKDSWPTMMKRRSGPSRRMMLSLQGECLGGISNSRREKEKENPVPKRAVTDEVASNPFEEAAPAGRPILWPTKIRIPTTWHKKERKGRKENRNDSNIPMMETKVIHPMTMAKEKADKTKENPKRSQPSQRSQRSTLPRSRLLTSQSLPTPVGQIKNGVLGFLCCVHCLCSKHSRCSIQDDKK